MRVGRSSRELKIDLATLQDEKKKKGPRRGKGTTSKQVEDEEARRRTTRTTKRSLRELPNHFKSIWGDIWSSQGTPKTTQMGPKKLSRAPKTSLREPQNTIKSIFRSQTLIFRKPSSRLHKIKVFEGQRVSLGAQNRHQEAPR